MNQVPSEDYLRDALTFTNEEVRLRKEINDWLPEAIIDVHTHANGPSVVGRLSANALTWVYSSFPDFSLEDSARVQEHFHPNKQIRYLRFANPYKGIDHVQANMYLCSKIPSKDRVAVVALPDRPEYTLREISSQKYVAVKSYPNYFEPPVRKIRDFFTLDILAAAVQADIPIILHVPSPLAICVEELLSIIREFPKLKIVLAHLGRHSHATDQSLAAFEALQPFEKVVVDTSMSPSPGVLKQVFKTFGINRVLYGSDEPMSLLRFVEYAHPTLGRRIMSNYPYHWLNPDQHREYGHLGKGAVHLHWQVLQAIREVLMELYPLESNEAKQLVFHDNALRFFPGFG